MSIAILMSFLTTEFHFCESFIVEVMEDFSEKQESLLIPSFAQLFIHGFYLNLWNISIQLFYVVFKTRYLSIIKEFKKLSH